MNLICRALRKLVSTTFKVLQSIGARISGTTNPIALVPTELSASDREDLLNRFQFYSPGTAGALEFRNEIGIRELFSQRPILLYGQSASRTWWAATRAEVFDVDSRRNPRDGGAWCQISKYGAPPSPVALSAEARLRSRIGRLKALALSKCYIFGTGVSLAQAIHRDWSDGYRVVCNTIVRDARLWRHIDPHFIVAGDGIYHFGFTAFARTFRADLAKRLRETDTCFVYPDLFNEIVLREFGEFENRLIPIPVKRRRNIHLDLTNHFALPALDNVLNILLLPLACTLSKNVNLWGFDGRAPGDNLFWSNSTQHSYPELMSSLQEAHPAFFDHYVPANDPGSYVRNVHGDQLDLALSAAEMQGWRFTMMHKSWTSTLQKRFSATD